MYRGEQRTEENARRTDDNTGEHRKTDENMEGQTRTEENTRVHTWMDECPLPRTSKSVLRDQERHPSREADLPVNDPNLRCLSAKILTVASGSTSRSAILIRRGPAESVRCSLHSILSSCQTQKGASNWYQLLVPSSVITIGG